jgi:hypothetical protein
VKTGAGDTVFDGSEQIPPSHPDSTREEALKANAIAALAQETRQPLALVREIFDEEYVHLRKTAQIADYVVLFATRRTRDALAKRSPLRPKRK